jgi:hypothetical protein
MSFSEYRKTVKLKKIKTCIIPLDLISCQYNPDYENVWRGVSGGSYKISSSPHYQFLCGYEEHYIKMHKGYGRNDLWITNKVLKFRRLAEDIRENGIKERPVVLNKPLVANDFNSGYEAWEAHHRLAIAMFLGVNAEVELCEIG